MDEVTHATPIDVAEREPLGTRIINSYRDMATKCIHSVPFWLSVAVLLLCAVYLATTGYGGILPQLVYPFAINIILVLAAIPLTAGRAAAPWEARVSEQSERTRIWFQLGLSLLCILIANYLVLGARNAVPLPTGMPIVGPFFASLQHSNGLGKGSGPAQSVIAISLVLQIVLPLVFVFLLGARWRYLGFCKGYRSLIMGLIGGATAIIIGLASLLLGKIGLLPLIVLFIQSFLIAGLTEELLFRGIFQTRLTRLFTPAWGIAISAFLFGLAHFGNFLPQLHFAVMATVSLVLLHNGFGGLVAGFIFWRTRNLLATTLMHGLNDAETPLHALLHLPF